MGVLHYCEDGHGWRVQEDGGVSPSWGYGLTSVTWEGYDAETCPEPQRGFSIYEGHGPYHGYKCPTCERVHYAGGCLMGVRFDPWNTPDPPCEPPPVCLKPYVRTLVWVDYNRRRPDEPSGWVELARTERSGQMAMPL